jgi:inosine-uridine nucleoside N-ribohydrolase
MRHTVRSLALAAVLVAAGCSPAAVTPAPASPSSATPTPTMAGATPRPVIVDADMDISDLFAVALLVRDPALDVRAIAIDGTGLVHCAGGRRVTRYLLEQLGREDVPFACGRESPGPNGRPFPDEWRVTADAAFGLDIEPVIETGIPEQASDLIARAIAGSPSAPLIVALGPWTNLADAFAADPSLATRVAGIHAMAGVIDAPGNVLVDGLNEADRLEWNVAADVDAFSNVLALDVPVDLVPLDATDDVPVPSDLLERLEEDHAAAGADLAYELLLRFPERLSLPGGQLWDELAALAVSDQSLVTWEQATVRVTEAGRIDRNPAGRAIRFASSADRGAVEASLLAGLRRGGPRTDPFAVRGDLTVRWDGTTCAFEGSTPEVPGMYRAHLVNDTPALAGLAVIGVRPPRGWDDVVALIAALQPGQIGEPPGWIVDGGFAEAAADATGSGLVELADGPAGAICLSGDWPDLTLVASDPFGVDG